MDSNKRLILTVAACFAIAIAFHFLYPLFQGMPDVGWRAMFWIAVLPAFFTLWIRKGVQESPVWLAR